ncbi:Trehalose transport system permease protein SugA [archaeon HR01]|nr:Trehalose transport system permease protein SugA [archaeon HR01]
MAGRLSALRRIETLFILPIEVLLWGIVMAPFILAIYLSFTNWSPAVSANPLDAKWVGLDNYISILTNARYLGAVLRTTIFALAGVLVQTGVGLALALLFYYGVYGRRILSTVMIMPMMASPLIVALMFYIMLFTRGPVNAFLSMLTGQNIEIRWLSSPEMAPVSVIMADSWMWTPLVFLITLSGLSLVPQDQIRAARIAGASELRVIKDILLPYIKPFILIAIIIRLLESFKLFDVAVFMTAGGPGVATETLSIYLYKEGFLTLRTAYIAAGAVVVLLALSLATYLMTRSIYARS